MSSTIVDNKAFDSTCIDSEKTTSNFNAPAVSSLGPTVAFKTGAVSFEGK